MPRATKAAARSVGRTQLSREAIVECALEVIQRDGPGTLTLRRLGTELGVDGTAVYRHFPDKDAIVLAVGDHVLRQTVDRLRESNSPDATWQDRIRALARAGWDSAEQYPGVISLTFARTTGESAERDIVELILSVIEPLGLPPEQTVLVYRMLGDLVLSLTGMNGTSLSMEPAVREKDATAWSRIYAVQPHQEFPATRRHMTQLITVTDREIYDFTIETVIAGIEAMLS